MEGKAVSASCVFNYDIDLDHLNPDGTLFEGRFMAIVNSVAMMVANRHTGGLCVAIGIDSLRFKKKVVQGDILLLSASVNRAWQTTLEVGVKVVGEELRSLDQKDVFSAYFTFAAVDENYQLVEIAPVIPETAEQIQRYRDAEIRHQRHREEEASVHLGINS